MWRATAASPTTATLSSGKASDLTVCLQFINGVMTRKQTVKSLAFPELKVAVADLRGRNLIEPGLVGFEDGPSQDFDVLGDRRLVGGGVGTGEAAEQKTRSGESDCACNRQVTTRDVHGGPPR